MVKTITTINGSEMLIDTQTIQHGATEVNRLVGQHSKLMVFQTLESLTHTGIKPRRVKHMRSIILEKHLDSGLHISFGGLGRKSAADQHQRTVSNETGDLFLRQKREIELLADVIDRCGQILFRIDQRAVEIKNENRPHELMITGSSG